MLLLMIMSCSEMEAPQQGSILFCPPSNIENQAENGDVQLMVSGELQEIRDGSGECNIELVIENEGETYTFGYSILDPDAVPQAQLPTWDVGQTVDVEYREKFVFGTTQSMLVHDDSGLMMALEEGYWGGSIDASELPFSVTWSALIVAQKESDCIITEGYSIVVDDVPFTPFYNDTFSVGDAEWDFYAVAAVQLKDGKTCSVSDKSDHFAWAAIRQ